MTNAALRGKPDAGNPHVRFDEGEVAPAATPRRGSLLYNTRKRLFGAVMLGAVMTAVGAHGFIVDADLPAGNIVVDGIDGNTVKVHQDLRDSDLWFYWAFRVKGPCRYCC